jgi:hypothetical protein
MRMSTELQVRLLAVALLACVLGSSSCRHSSSGPRVYAHFQLQNGWSGPFRSYHEGTQVETLAFVGTGWSADVRLDVTVQPEDAPLSWDELGKMLPPDVPGMKRLVGWRVRGARTTMAGQYAMARSYWGPDTRFVMVYAYGQRRALIARLRIPKWSEISSEEQAQILGTCRELVGSMYWDERPSSSR